MALARPAGAMQFGSPQSLPMAPAPLAPQEPNIAGKFAGTVAQKMAAQKLAEMGTSAMDPTGGIATGVAKEMAAPALGKLVGGWFRMGGQIPKPMYQRMGGMTPGPLGMSDMLAAGKGKDVSKVTYKKKGGEIEDVMEISYHAPLAPKSE